MVELMTACEYVEEPNRKCSLWVRWLPTGQFVENFD